MKKILYLALIVVGATCAAARVQAQVIVIANLSVKATDVSKEDLRDLFTGASSGLKGTPVLLKDGPANEEFLSTYIGKKDAAFHASWRSLVFSGQASMPKSVDSESAVVEYVAHTPGSVGYIGKATAHEGVKVLVVK